MISLKNVSKYYPTRFGPNYILKDLNIDIPDDRDVAILGKNGAGKTTLMRMIGGIDFPTRGKIVSDRFISWPLGIATGFNAVMTGRENVRYVCRIHGIKDTRPVEEFVREFAEIDDNFDLPIGGYSSGMRMKYGFAVSMGFDFDTYLMDEIMAVGDAAFKQKCSDTLKNKRSTSNIILVSHNMDIIREHCNAAIFLAYGRAEFYESVEQAIYRYIHS
ncbi:ABC transporter ATP-binding protein [Kordiimonas sp. SCSIO 12610]|uniref:ABC transporter ATP-binding protein n=1 Tax=Kordiimonas sp. SCSIO 12610 TaxID=2829597 RepID=UPI00210D34DC|nr:ABC transporter ATP-binding protein [Kordiimonas sp. SCSIO 12610]UTW56253.1 ABC transporter ATP-binding protein [Kordiimonas sp. SCSIO 12610]